MSLDRDTLIRTAESLLELAHALEPQEPISFFGQPIRPGEGWRQMRAIWDAERLAELAKPAPFGRYPDGKRRPAPAYDKARALWEAAMRAKAFSIFDPDFADNPAAVEAAIETLAAGWGKEWLAHDENAAMIDPAYQKKWLGYVVRRKNQNDHTQGYDRIPG